MISIQSRGQDVKQKRRNKVVTGRKEVKLIICITHILNFLNRSMESREIISVFTDREQPEKCSVGIVAAVSQEQVLINHITPLGRYDGYVVRRIDNIFGVDIDGQYEQKLEILYNLQAQTHPQILNRKISAEDNIFLEVLNRAQECDLIVNVCVDDSETQESIIGFVKNISDIDVVINRVSENGRYDGEIVFLIADIVKLNCDSDEKQALKLLSDEQNNSKHI